MKKSKIVISVIILILIVVLSLMCIFMNKSTFIKQFKGNNDNLNAGTAKEITLNANGGTGGTSKIF